MRAGRLDRRVVIQQPTESQDSVGGVAQSWATLDTVWAEVVAIRGREYVGGAQVNTERTLTFRIRYRSDMTEKDRIVYEGYNYDIQHLAELGRRQGLEIVGKRPS